MKIALLGDIALIGKYDLTKNSSCFKRLKKVKAYLEQFDYVIGNLESPLTDVTKTWIPKSMHLKSPCRNIEVLKYLDINAVSIANNHTYDFGEKGFNETVETLELWGIEWFGANGKYLQIRQNGESVNISGFCCASTNGVHLGSDSTSKKCIHLLTRCAIENQLEKDNNQGAFSLIVNHWGQEHTSYPSKETVKIARKIAELKSNLVIVAHHPHQIQGVEKFNNNLIAYSLGNFLFDDCVSINGKMRLPQTEVNKKTFVLELIIENNELKTFQIQGFVDDDENGLVQCDIVSEIDNISASIKNYDSEEYENVRKRQIADAQQRKFGRHDLLWLVSRFNYYAIGAKLLTFKMKSIYGKSQKSF